MRIHAMRLHAWADVTMCVRVPARARLRGMPGAGYMKGYIRVCGACCSIVCLSNMYLSRSVRCNLHLKPNGSYQLPEIDHIRAFARADTALTHTRARAQTHATGAAQRVCAVSISVRACVCARACAQACVCVCSVCAPTDARARIHRYLLVLRKYTSLPYRAHLSMYMRAHGQGDRYIHIYIYTYIYNRACFRSIGIAMPFDSIFSVSFR
jgi:hypothetical protein